MPAIFRKDGKKKELIKNLGTIYQNIQREQQISPGDFPELKKMQVCSYAAKLQPLIYLFVFRIMQMVGKNQRFPHLVKKKKKKFKPFQNVYYI